jgi:hypothetical protein
MEKGSDFPGIKAAKVIDIMPFLELLPHATHIVQCDDEF